ncbi:root determined nodulation 1 [Striga asiatica]|uniref:Root determined nodulation 1 n=1 Tax=Striga asiatica TaxID=4170 RepID=A0A5A7QLQ1_STRAF|nr:root determined nodulation 1 [Striga asiatica]
MGRQVLLIFVVLLVFGAFYNLSTVYLHHRRVGPVKIEPVTPMPFNERKTRIGKSFFHIAVTGEDSAYSKWQCRIMYYWFKKKKDLPGSEMGGLTRILHSGVSDDLMDEIPTFVVDPLPEGMDKGYVVLNRPWAFVQWLKKAEIKEEYVLMAEPDHIFLQPLPNLVYEEYPAAYSFFYMKPVKYAKIVRKFFPKKMGPITNVDPIGNSPVIIKKETDEKFGWVLEMYAYAVASALHGVQHILRKEFMLQPPFDSETEGKFILHYTYGCDYNSEGELLIDEKGEWRFDKRDYLHSPPPRNLTLPPQGAPESVATLVKLINEATANLPNWDSSEHT